MSAEGFVRALAGCVAALGIVGAAVAPSIVRDTHAAWTDDVVVSVPVTAGTWGSTVPMPPANGCIELLPDLEEAPNGTCEILSVTFSHEGWNGTVRYYNIVAQISSWENRPRVNVDLSAVPGGSRPDWTWDHAMAVPTGSFAPAPGFECAPLPTVIGDGPAGWGPRTTLQVEVLMDGRTSTGGSSTCG